MQSNNLKYLVIFGLVFLSVGCMHLNDRQKLTEKPFIGVKIYEYDQDLVPLFQQWHDLGINTVFVSVDLNARQEFRDLARRYDIKRFVILPIFYNEDYLRLNPDSYAITNQGEKAIDDWVHFVCPTRPDYRQNRIEYINNMIQNHDPDCISLDFIRYFAFWEKIYPDRTISSMANTCFCDHCMAAFQKETGITIPSDLLNPADKAHWINDNCWESWVDWKCRVILGMVQDIAHQAKQLKPDILINLHAVPWRVTDFEGAIKTVAGQDFPALSQYVDFISPMCYHHMVKREPQWISSVVKDISRQVNCPVLPSIQVNRAYLRNRMTTEEFGDALHEALAQPSAGVILWNWDALVSDAEKQEIFKSKIN